MQTVITRQWHGITLLEKADRYLHYLEQTGIPGYQKCKGLLSVAIWRKADGDRCHFWTVTTWDSWESLERFTGPDRNRAHYYPQDADYLLTLEPEVQHFETFIYT